MTRRELRKSCLVALWAQQASELLLHPYHYKCGLCACMPWPLNSDAIVVPNNLKDSSVQSICGLARFGPRPHCFSVVKFWPDMTSPCRTLQGLLGKLGAGFDDLMPGGGLTSSQLKVRICNANAQHTWQGHVAPMPAILHVNGAAYQAACWALYAIHLQLVSDPHSGAHVLSRASSCN